MPCKPKYENPDQTIQTLFAAVSDAYNSPSEGEKGRDGKKKQELLVFLLHIHHSRLIVPQLGVYLCAFNPSEPELLFAGAGMHYIFRNSPILWPDPEVVEVSAPLPVSLFSSSSYSSIILFVPAKAPSVLPGDPVADVFDLYSFGFPEGLTALVSFYLSRFSADRTRLYPTFQFLLCRLYAQSR